MSTDRITIDDCIILGNAEPSIVKDGRVTVCTAGYSEKLGLIRIYPIPPQAPAKRGNILKISLEKDSRDTRNESWKVQGSKDDWSQLANKIESVGSVKDKDRKNLLKSLYSAYGVNCINDLNQQKKSLG